jgi:hypothetical protein
LNPEDNYLKKKHKTHRYAYLWVYADKDDTHPILIVDPPRNLTWLLREWNKLDLSMCAGEHVPEWDYASEWLAARGVQVVRPRHYSLDDYYPKMKESRR